MLNVVGGRVNKGHLMRKISPSYTQKSPLTNVLSCVVSFYYRVPYRYGILNVPLGRQKKGREAATKFALQTFNYE